MVVAFHESNTDGADLAADGAEPVAAEADDPPPETSDGGAQLSEAAAEDSRLEVGVLSACGLLVRAEMLH